MVNFVKTKVALLGVLGSDLTVVNAARVSFDKESDYVNDGMDKHLSERDEKLIKYLAEHNHWSPFSHCFLQFRIKAPIFVARQLQKHCLSGDSTITFIGRANGASNSKKKVKIKDLYDMWSGKYKYQGGNKGKYNVKKRNIRVYNEYTKKFELSKILDVIYQGKKITYSIVADNGSTIRATSDHLFYTNFGWKKLKDLKVGDFLVTDIKTPIKLNNKPLRCNDSADVIARRNVQRSFCATCGSVESLEVDHIIPVNMGGTHLPENLQVLCAPCHKDKTKNEKIPQSPLIPYLTKILKIEEFGVEDVYDLTIDKIHNFMANDVLVHNCVGLAWNEISRRYVDNEPEYLDIRDWRKKAENKKQGSSDELVTKYTVEGHGYSDENKVPYDVYVDLIMEANYLYSEMLEAGIAPEQARALLPQSTMTEWFWSGSLYAFARVCNLRNSPDAQKETQDVTLQIDKYCKEEFPVSWKYLCP